MLFLQHDFHQSWTRWERGIQAACPVKCNSVFPSGFIPSASCSGQSCSLYLMQSDSCSPPSSFQLRFGVENKSTQLFLEKVLSLNRSSDTSFCFGCKLCLSFHTQGRVIADRL